MRGSVIKRGNTWSVVVYMGRDPSTRKKRYHWIKGGRTKKEAERKLAELLHQVDQGSYVKPSKKTLGEFLATWLEVYASVSVRQRTYESYQERAAHIVDVMGNIPLSELKPQHLQHYYSTKMCSKRRDGKPGGLSSGTLIKHHNLLKQALGHAVKWGLLARNVADAVDAPRVSRKEMRTLSVEETHRLLEACNGTIWHPLFHTAIWTGLRRSELLGLRWKDLDLDFATLQVVQVMHQLKDGSRVFLEPKTVKSRRAVALSPSSCLVLRSHLADQKALASHLGFSLAEDALVFAHPDGTPLAPAGVTHAFSRISRKCGIHGVRLHDLRHTHASQMLKAGVHPKIVSERLGHASINITLDTYSHVLPGLQEAAALRFDEGMAQMSEDRAEAAVNVG